MSALSKKILLIKPDYKFFPIGFGLVVAALEKNGIEYDFVDTYLDPDFDLAGLLARNDYLAVATGGLIGNFTFYRSLFSRVKELAPHVPCVLGGNITIDLDSGILFYAIPADYLVIGEGEITFPELLQTLDAKGDPNTVKGIKFRSPDNPIEIIKTPKRERLDLESYNWMPSWNFFDAAAYNIAGFPILTGRGCTGHCSFCSPTNGWFRPRPLPFIMEELEMVNASLGKNWVFLFLNEILFSTDEEILAFCDAYETLTPHRRWDCLLRPDISPETLLRMNKAGCRVINVGVESGSERVLGEIIKETHTYDMRDFLKMAKDNTDLIIQGSYMTANYTEKAEDVAQTIDLLLDAKVDGPMALTINYPGTRNYRMALKRGLVGESLDEQVAYLESLDAIYSKGYVQVITGHLNGDLHYLNLSDMTDDELFHTVEWEMRRYHSHQKVLEKPVFERDEEELITQISGTCPLCGAPMEKKFDDSALSLSDARGDCRRCARDIHFPIADIGAVKAHCDPALAALETADSFVVVGGTSEIEKFCYIDLFGIDYDKFTGILASPEQEPGHYVLTHQIHDLDTIEAMNPDVILAVNAVPKEVQAQLDARPALKARLFQLVPGSASLTFAQALEKMVKRSLRDNGRRVASDSTGHGFTDMFDQRQKLLQAASLLIASEVQVAAESLGKWSSCLEGGEVRSRAVAYAFGVIMFSSIEALLRRDNVMIDGVTDEDRFGLCVSLCRGASDDVVQRVYHSGNNVAAQILDSQSEQAMILRESLREVLRFLVLSYYGARSTKDSLRQKISGFMDFLYASVS